MPLQRAWLATPETQLLAILLPLWVNQIMPPWSIKQRATQFTLVALKNWHGLRSP
jgi:hypothetical protein